MEKKISPGLKYLFLVHMIVGGIFGLIFLLFPEIWGNLIGWPVKEPVICRLFAAAIWGLTASSWFASLVNYPLPVHLLETERRCAKCSSLPSNTKLRL